MNNEQIIAPTSSLGERLKAFKQENPKVRIRDAARQLGVSEAELVAVGDGSTVIRLAEDWEGILTSLEPLGDLMALTRNEHAVHERKGVYRNVSINGPMGLVLDEEIDLRLFLGHWHFGFAVIEEGAHGTRRSLQFFDQDGTAVHKIYLQETSDLNAWEALVEKFRREDQDMTLDIRPVPPAAKDLPDEEIDFAGLYTDWRNMQDTHEFFGLLRKFKVGRLQALRNADHELARPVHPGSFRQTLQLASAEEVAIMVFVASPGVIQIHGGPVERVVATGPWFNVLDPRFNLHLREDHIATAWAVSKPTSDGVVSSLELFAADGELIALLFGKRKPGVPEDPKWRAIVERLGEDVPEEQQAA